MLLEETESGIQAACGDTQLMQLLRVHAEARAAFMRAPCIQEASHLGARRFAYGDGAFGRGRRQLFGGRGFGSRLLSDALCGEGLGSLGHDFHRMPGGPDEGWGESNKVCSA